MQGSPSTSRYRSGVKGKCTQFASRPVGSKSMSRSRGNRDSNSIDRCWADRVLSGRQRPPIDRLKVKTCLNRVLFKLISRSNIRDRIDAHGGRIMVFCRCTALCLLEKRTERSFIVQLSADVHGVAASGARRVGNLILRLFGARVVRNSTAGTSTVKLDAIALAGDSVSLTRAS